METTTTTAITKTNLVKKISASAQQRVTDLEAEKGALESKYARSNPLNEALEAKQKAESAARVANENLNALQQASGRELETRDRIVFGARKLFRCDFVSL